MSNILDLPGHILTKIFGQLRHHDMVKLTETCTTFNDHISRSSVLMRRWTLVCKPNRNVSLMLKSKRKYKSIHFENHTVLSFKESFKNILEHFNGHIEIFEIQYSEVFARDFEAALMIIKDTVKTIRAIKVEYVDNFTSGEKSTVEFPNTFEEFCFSSSNLRCLLHFSKTKIKKFYLCGSMNGDIEYKYIAKHFLMLQKDLKYFYVKDMELFNEDVSEIFKFKLLESNMVIETPNALQMRNLCAFLRSQVDMRTLEMFIRDLTNDEVCPTILELKNLIKLNICFADFIFNSNMFLVKSQSIKRLKFWAIIEGHEATIHERKLIASMLNLESIYFDKLKVTPDLLILIDQLQRMKQIKWSDCIFSAVMTIPKITAMEFQTKDTSLGMVNMVASNRHLEDITLSFSQSNLTQLEILMRCANNLRRLNIAENRDVSAECLTLIEENCQILETVLIPTYLNLDENKAAVARLSRKARVVFRNIRFFDPVGQ